MHISVSPPSLTQVSVPFPVIAGLGEVIRHPGWVEALNAVRTGLKAGSSVVLAGEPGSGKSLLLLTLMREFEAEGRTVILLPGSKIEAGVQPDLVLLDEADRVPRDMLTHLVGRAPRCILVGSRRLLDVVEGAAAAPLLVEMRPLLPKEVAAYLLEQIQRAGLPDSLLGPGTVQAIAHHGRGNPRQIQKLASRALFRAWIDNANEVSTAHVADTVAQNDPSGVRSADPPHQDAPPFAEKTEPPRLTVPSAERQPVLSPALLPSGGLSLAHHPSRVHSLASGMAVVGLAVLGLLAWHGREPATVATLPPQPIIPGGTTEAPGRMVSGPGPGVALDPVPQPTPPALVASGALTPVMSPHSKPIEPPLPLAAAKTASLAAPPASTFPEPAAAMPPDPPRTPQDPVLSLVAAIPALIRAPSSQDATAAQLPEAAMAPLPRPGTIPVHVLVTFPRSDAAAGNRGVSLTGALKEAGMDAVLMVGSVTAQKSVVRYFYGSDQAAAARVARRMGEPGHEQLAVMHGDPPRPGTIQVVLSSQLTPGR